VADDAPYGIEDLARLGGVSRRTIRYYIQEGLLPAPLGLGRGRHYGPDHLAQLTAVKALQGRGLSLDEVRRELETLPLHGFAASASPAVWDPARAQPPSEPAVARPTPAGPARPPMEASAWQRVELVPGVELHVNGSLPLPSPAGLRELAEWCERHLRV
jgi:Ca-activated chloride channel family protein